MKRKVAGAIALAFALVSGHVLLGIQPAAQGQKPEKAQQWEYKIYKATDDDFAKDKAEKEFNKLASEGWEFVQVVVSRGPPQPGPAPVIPPVLHGTTCVLFKRAKK